MQDTARLLRLYAEDPARIGVTPRQSRKLADRLAAIDADPGTAIARALEVGRARAALAEPTVYVVNAGGSGSHWLQKMLCLSAPFLGCGEVYFPDSLLEVLRTGSRSERLAFVQAVYAVFAWKSPCDLRRAPAINTAHKPRTARLADVDIQGRTILLVRDPADIVMSRSFRKAEYRADQGYADQPDDLYFERNLTYVRNFYRQALAQSYDLRVRYEDLRSRPHDSLRDVLAGLGLDPDPVRLDAAVAATLPTGPRPESDPAPAETAFAEAARARLAGLRESLGYV